MHKIFAWSAVLLLATTLLMMYKDENRSWRKYQDRAAQLKLERIEREREQFNDAQYQADKEALQNQIDALQDEWDSRSADLKEKEKQATSLKGRLEIESALSKQKNAERDKARADYDIQVRDQAPAGVLAKYKAIFDQAQQDADEQALKATQADAAYKAMLSEINQERRELDDALARRDELIAAEETLLEQKDQIEPESIGKAFTRWFKQIPIIEGFDPIYKIQYDWPRDLTQDLGMTTVDRVDRCRSCHVNINDFSVIRKNGEVVGMTETYTHEEYEEPFCSHPRPDLFLTATSPHPINDFGCTICHGGDGSGTSFQNAEHTPSDPAMAEEWAEKHHWHSNHFWEEPMRPKQFLESSCLKCHHDVVELGKSPKYGSTAPTVVKGWETIVDFGCFGCHEINGYDGTTPIGPDLRLEPNSPEELAAIEADPNQIPGELRKVGPSLRHIAEKTTPEFIAHWTEEPSRFRPNTRMPQFFNLTNQHDAMAELLQPMEIAGITSFLLAKSEELEMAAPQADYQVDIKRGADLFANRGCLACHSKQGEQFAGIDAVFGPDLSRIHEKIKPGQEGFLWMYNWIKEPTKYHARTRMPDLFLEPYEDELSGTYIDPAADIAAYLLEGEAGEFPALPTPETHLGLVVAELTEEKSKDLRLTEDQFRGILVTEIVKGSPADRVELQLDTDLWQPDRLRPDDILVSIGGSPVRSIDDFNETQAEIEPGQMLTLTVLRDRREVKVRMTASTPLDDLVRLYLSKVVGQSGVDQAFTTKRFPVTFEMYADGRTPADFLKGDEVELVPATFDEQVTDEQWHQRKLLYIGRRTISRYGCYGCHDVPEFEAARPIGAALNDWGRKDTSKLAYEHIHEYLHHHGEIDSHDSGNRDHDDAHSGDDHGHDDEHAALGSSTAERMERIVKAAQAGEEVPQEDLTEAMLYKSVISHGRDGFLWQKLRQPRSYDYKKTETKNWDERLRMPKFPFRKDQIEAVSTFVLGLVAQPPVEEFQFRPSGADEAIFEGERLLAKYNCTGCHVLEMDRFEFAINPQMVNAKAVDPSALAEHYSQALNLLHRVKPLGDGPTGETVTNAEGDEEALYRTTAFIQGVPDPEEEDPEFRIYSLRFWDGFTTEEGKYVMPGEAVPVTEGQLRGKIEGRGGEFGKWLVNKLAPELSKTPGGNDFNAAWQASVPPLTGEGHKVRPPWLYQFLKNPEPLRRAVVLRMPRFNMSDEEARVLANYFAAIDGVPFPYQSIPQTQADYQTARSAEYQQQYPGAEHDFLAASWNVLNGPECRKCHNVGGNIVNDPKQVKGPNLQRVEKRLRPDWTQLWVYKPMWIYPYTAMPENFPPDKPSGMPKLFGGSNSRQAEAAIDALFNYSTLLEAHGPTTYNPESATAPVNAGGAE